MMDGSPLYPEGFHPAHQYRHPTTQRFAKKRRRLYSSPVKYYFIDFGLSVMYNEEWETDPRHWNGFSGHEQKAPEILGYNPETSYDAYLLDVFILGKIYERSLLKRYSNIDIFLNPIAEGTTREDPTARITPEDALAMLSRVRQSLNIFRLRARLHLRKESKRRTFLNDIRAFISDTPYILKACLSHSFSKVRSWLYETRRNNKLYNVHACEQF